MPFQMPFPTCLEESARALHLYVLHVLVRKKTTILVGVPRGKTHRPEKPWSDFPPHLALDAIQHVAVLLELGVELLQDARNGELRLDEDRRRIADLVPLAGELGQELVEESEHLVGAASFDHLRGGFAQLDRVLRAGGAVDQHARVVREALFVLQVESEHELRQLAPLLERELGGETPIDEPEPIRFGGGRRVEDVTRVRIAVKERRVVAGEDHVVGEDVAHALRELRAIAGRVRERRPSPSRLRRTPCRSRSRSRREGRPEPGLPARPGSTPGRERDSFVRPRPGPPARAPHGSRERCRRAGLSPMS